MDDQEDPDSDSGDGLTCFFLSFLLEVKPEPGCYRLA